MALNISFFNKGDENPVAELNLHADNFLIEQYMFLINIHDHVEIQADGHELSKSLGILSMNKNWQASDIDGDRVYTFVGDQAKTIILNWNRF